jgi:hypothetical protein
MNDLYFGGRYEKHLACLTMIALSKLGNGHEALALLEKALTLDPANQYILDAKSRLQS